MKSGKNKSRRQFLKNISLAALPFWLIPDITKASSKGKSRKQSIEECEITTLDYYGQGPFYTISPPAISNGQLASSNEPGTRLIISGRVYNLECTQVIPGTSIDIWHANDAGYYDNTGYNLRGVSQSNSQGFYMFETIKPGKYLNGSQYRPSHIHFKITPPGFPTLTTQLYFEGDSDIPQDAAASITSGTYDATSRIIPLTLNNDGKYEGTWDIVIDGSGVTGVNDLYIDKGMIYKAGPNPFKDYVEINYGVFRSSEVSLQVYDIHGRLVAVLEERKLNAGKYTAIWNPEVNIPDGHYFAALKINDLQVHYIKLICAK